MAVGHHGISEILTTARLATGADQLLLPAGDQKTARGIGTGGRCRLGHGLQRHLAGLKSLRIDLNLLLGLLTAIQGHLGDTGNFQDLVVEGGGDDPAQLHRRRGAAALQGEGVLQDRAQGRDEG